MKLLSKISPVFLLAKKYKLVFILIPSFALFLIGTYFLFFYYQQAGVFKSKIDFLTSEDFKVREQLASLSGELTNLKNEDQYKINKKLESDIKSIEDTYKKTVTLYESLLDLKKSTKTDKLDELLAKSLKLLSDRNYSSASAVLADLDKQVKEQESKVAAAFKIPENIPTNNAPPSSGYRRQQVQIDTGSFMVDIVTADLNNTRVIVDTASSGDCTNDCPVLSLGDYVSRNSAFAGINGSYFCPAAYPSCAGKTNSFDTLLMNKNKTYFNSANNVYSTVPAVIFSGNSARFVSQSLQWGRDTGVDAVLANYPLLTLNGQNTFGGSSDPKHTSKGPRGFVGAAGNTVFIGIVYNATVAEATQVLQTLGVTNSLNLDSGGSTALWSGGYKAGPGRNIPNALLLVRK